MLTGLEPVGLPKSFFLLWAPSKPAFALSLIKFLSNSEITPKIWIIYL